MAVIISSTFVLGHEQVGGSRRVTETHTWDGGVAPTIIEYGPVPAGTDYQSIADARAVVIMASRADQEASENLDNATYNLIFQTETHMLEWIRDAYLASLGVETCRISQWIIERLNDGSFSAADIRAVWGLTVPQWNSFQNGILDLQYQAYVSVLAADGTVT